MCTWVLTVDDVFECRAVNKISVNITHPCFVFVLFKGAARWFS